MPVIVQPSVIRDELAKRLEPALGSLTPEQRATVKAGVVTALAETIAVCLKGGISVDGTTRIPEPQVTEGP